MSDEYQPNPMKTAYNLATFFNKLYKREQLGKNFKDIPVAKKILDFDEAKNEEIDLDGSIP